MDGYIDISFADSFLENYPDGKLWAKLTLEEKKSLIFKASLNIDSLQNIKFGFKYSKFKEEQPFEFPRGKKDEIPKSVKVACVLETFGLCDLEAEARRKLKRQRVSNIKIGEVSESYSRVINRESGGFKSIEKLDYSNYMASFEAFNIISQFLNKKGVYSII